MPRERRTMTNNMSALLWDIKERAKTVLAGLDDGGILDDLQLAHDLSELSDVSRRAGRVVIDSGELTPHALRLLRDFERGRPGVLTRFDEWSERSGSGSGDAA